METNPIKLKEKQFPSRLYQYLIRVGETIFNVSASSSEDANQTLKQLLDTQFIPNLKKPETVIPIEAKLVHIHDLKNFGQAIDMPPTETIEFKFNPSEEVAKMDEAIKVASEARSPPAEETYEIWKKALREQGYTITKKRNIIKSK